jgi:hypothetical protein
MTTIKDLQQARKEAERAQRKCENIMRDIAAEANYILHYTYKSEWQTKGDAERWPSGWHVKFCDDPDEARTFIKNQKNMLDSYYIAKPCVMDTSAFMDGDNLALADYTHK